VAEFERELIKDRVNAGLAAARARGAKLGRPNVSYEFEDEVYEMRKQGYSGRKIAKALGISPTSVFNILRQSI